MQHKPNAKNQTDNLTISRGVHYDIQRDPLIIEKDHKGT